MTETMKTQEFKVPVENLPKLEKKIAELNKKAAKLNTKPNRIIFGERVREEVKKETPTASAIYRTYQMLTVEGEIPVLPGGWMFMGKLEPHSAGTIVKSMPGQELPLMYHTADAEYCEHCNIRRQRNATFIVKNGDGGYKQVGRSCLKDFLGHASPEHYASYAEFLSTLEDTMREFERDSMAYVPNYMVLDVLTAAVVAIDRDGFTGTSDYTGKQNTRTTVLEYFHPPVGPAAKYFTPLVVEPKDSERAVEVIKFIKAKALVDLSEFWQNLNKFVTPETVESKYFGYLAAAAMMYQKELGTLAAKESIKDGVISGSIGDDGERVVVKAKVIGAHRYSRQSYHYGDSGISQVLTLKTDLGYLIKMFTTNLDIKKDDTVSVSGKINKCEVEQYENSPFKGFHITLMQPRTRITVLAEIDRTVKNDGVVSVKGVPVPEDTAVKVVKHDQFRTILYFDGPKGKFEKIFKPKEVLFA